jgi:hypothetical protein
MDAQFWIYIIIGVIYFLSKLLKKPAEAPEETADTRPAQRRQAQPQQNTTERPKQLTFEELLREITQAKQPAKPVQEPDARPRYESFDNDLGDEARSLEEVRYDEAENARVFKAYEDAKTQVFQRSSLEETLHLKDTVMNFGKFKVFETQRSKNALLDYMNIIRSPESLKHAIVMSEILKRKF